MVLVAKRQEEGNRGFIHYLVLFICGVFETGAWSTDLTELNLHLLLRQPSKHWDHSLG